MSYLKEQVEENEGTNDPKKLKYLRGFYTSIMDGIQYYRGLLENKILPNDGNFLENLVTVESDLNVTMERLLLVEA